MSLRGKIGFVSLGCAKATVDSERIITELRVRGFVISDSYQDSDLVIVNTCGFINEAVDESVSAIAEAVSECEHVVVTGCLGAKADMLKKKFPTLIEVTGPQETQKVLQAVQSVLPALHDPFEDLVPLGGIKLTPRHYAYLKISEGCNHKCSFCIIPSMRGKLVSRRPSEILQEASNLVSAGVKELLIVSQDTSAYGVDTKYQPDFFKQSPVKSHINDLCRALGQLGVWLRLHYVYPYPLVDDLIPLMQEGLILPYLDIPFQHGSPKILKSMKRPAHSEKVLRRLESWRETCPELSVRSTFIVGFPGETDEDFEILLDFIRTAKIDRAGCFKYSDVEGAKSRGLENKVSELEKETRYQVFMETQKTISHQKLQEKIGRVCDVLIDEVSDTQTVGRTKGDAPEVDGVVFFQRCSDNLVPGQIVKAKITNSLEYDLIADEVISD